MRPSLQVQVATVSVLKGPYTTMLQADRLERVLGVSFRDRAVLELAFVHSSYLNENPEALLESNERLEFLGDALLGLVVAQDVYRLVPGGSEGVLTSIRSALVRGETLARVANSLQLGEYLLMGRGEEASGGRNRESNLAATFEALVGALFLDQGYGPAREFVSRILSEELTAAASQGVSKNPKSLLQELVQERGEGSPSYRIVDESGEDHAREFTAEVFVSGKVLGLGTGRRKVVAEQEAARNALRGLG